MEKLVQLVKQIVLSQKLTMLQQASNYDLMIPEERQRSVGDLEKLFFRLAGYIQPSHFIEAGAKNAQVSARARRRLPDSRIVAFEANPHSYKKYKDNEYIKASDIQYIHKALSSEVGELEFSLQAESDGIVNSKTQGNGSIQTPKSDTIKLETHTVEATTLDAEFAEDDLERAFIWVDVEGAQNLVLTGGANTFESGFGVAFIEIEDREVWTGQWLTDDVHAFMIERGFVPLARDFQSRYQYNVLYVKEAMLEIDYVLFCLQMHLSSAMTGGRPG